MMQNSAMCCKVVMYTMWSSIAVEPGVFLSKPLTLHVITACSVRVAVLSLTTAWQTVHKVARRLQRPRDVSRDLDLMICRQAYYLIAGLQPPST